MEMQKKNGFVRREYSDVDSDLFDGWSWASLLLIPTKEIKHWYISTYLT